MYPDSCAPYLFKLDATELSARGEEQCGICYESLKSHAAVERTICGHTYGSKCIRKWIGLDSGKPNNTCPHCRHKFFTKPVSEDSSDSDSDSDESDTSESSSENGESSSNDESSSGNESSSSEESSSSDESTSNEESSSSDNSTSDEESDSSEDDAAEEDRSSAVVSRVPAVNFVAARPSARAQQIRTIERTGNTLAVRSSSTPNRGSRRTRRRTDAQSFARRRTTNARDLVRYGLAREHGSHDEVGQHRTDENNSRRSNNVQILSHANRWAEITMVVEENVFQHQFNRFFSSALRRENWTSGETLMSRQRLERYSWLWIHLYNLLLSGSQIPLYSLHGALWQVWQNMQFLLQDAYAPLNGMREEFEFMAQHRWTAGIVYTRLCDAFSELENPSYTSPCYTLDYVLRRLSDRTEIDALAMENGLCASVVQKTMLRTLGLAMTTDGSESSLQIG